MLKDKRQDDTPLISVVALSYNHEQYVTSTLESIVAQTGVKLELLIFDDASTDNSQKTIEQWITETKTDCAFFPHNKNIGLCATLNEATKLCSGKYIQFIACDDILCPGKLKEQIAQLEAKPDCALCCSDFSTIDKNGAIIGNNYFPADYEFPEDVFCAILYGHHDLPVVIHSPSVIVRRSVLQEMGPYPEQLPQEDFYMWLAITSKYPVCFVAKPLVQYRRLDGSLSDHLTRQENKDKYLNSHIEAIDILLERHGNRMQELLHAKIQKLAKIAIWQIRQTPNRRELRTVADDYLLNIDQAADMGKFGFLQVAIEKYPILVCALKRGGTPSLSNLVAMCLGGIARYFQVTNAAS